MEDIIKPIAVKPPEPIGPVKSVEPAKPKQPAQAGSPPSPTPIPGPTPELPKPEPVFEYAPPINITPEKYAPFTPSEYASAISAASKLYNTLKLESDLVSDFSSDIAGPQGFWRDVAVLSSPINVFASDKERMETVGPMLKEAQDLYVYTSWKAEVYSVFTAFVSFARSNPDFDGKIKLAGLGNVTFDEFIQATPVPADIDKYHRRSDLEKTISKMSRFISDLSAVPPSQSNPEYQKAKGPGDLTPELEIPRKIPGRQMMALRSMTTAEIARALNPMEKSTTVTPEEWEELFNGPEPTDADIKSQAEDLIASAEQLRIDRDYIRQNGFSLPSYSALDYAKFAFIQPMAASLDIMNVYFNKVIRPVTAFTLMSNPWLFNGLDNSYREAISNGLNPWDAATVAWEDWDVNWGYKMAFETAFDPLTYLGWGILAKLPVIGARGVVGLNIIGKLDLGMKFGFDAFGDATKAMLSHLISTPFQRSLEAERYAGGIFKKYIQRYGGNYIGNISTKPIIRTLPNGTEVVTSQWKDLIDSAIKLGDSGVVTGTLGNEVGRILLKHSPIMADDIIRWGDKVGVEITTDSITAEMLRDINTEFTAMMNKMVGQSTSARRILSILGADINPENVKYMSRDILGAKRRGIIDQAKSFGDSTNTYKSARQFMKRAGKLELEWSDFNRELDRLHSGEFKKLIYDVEPKFIQLWSKYIERGLAICVLPLEEYSLHV